MLCIRCDVWEVQLSSQAVTSRVLLVYLHMAIACLLWLMGDSDVYRPCEGVLELFDIGQGSL